MEFNEEKANEIIKKYNLAETTFRVWKTRGQIPDKYATDDYKPRKNLAVNMDSAHARVLELLRGNTINAAGVAASANVAYQKIIDMHEIRLSEDDFNAVRRVLKEIKLHAAKAAVNSIELRKFLNRSEIFVKPIFYDLEKKEYEQLHRFRDRKIELTNQVREKVKDMLYVFGLTINI